jgi:hypothetical protein
MRARKPSEETIAKISVGNKGKKRSKEFIAKMIESKLNVGRMLLHACMHACWPASAPRRACMHAALKKGYEVVVTRNHT